MQTVRDQFAKVDRIQAMVGAKGLLPHNKPRSHFPLEFNCKVRLLDEAQKPLIIKVKREWTGRQLFEEACREVGGIAESDYFGLRYLDRKGERQWLDLRLNVFQQLKYTVPCVVSFRVKHYPPRPLEDLRQDISRYFLYLQLRRDLQHGRLLCSPTDSQELAACVAQAELGDRSNVKDQAAAITELRLLPSMNAQALSKICDLHGKLSGYLPVEAESEFLEKVSRLDTYGVDPYPVKDQKGNTLYLGLTHEGVATFRGNRRSHIFRWNEITRFSYERRIFIIHVTLRDDTHLQRKKKHVLGFKCQSRRTAAAIWRWAIDRQYFFTLHRGSDARRHKSGGGFFRRGNKFRFSGRCRQETLRMSEGLTRQPQPQFFRSSSCRHISQKSETGQRSPATLPRARGDNHPLANGTFPRSNGGPSVQFLLTSTPVKSRPTLLLHNSADEITCPGIQRFNEISTISEIAIDEQHNFDQNQTKGISAPDLSYAHRSRRVEGNLVPVSLSGLEVTDSLIQAPLNASQVSVESSTRHSSDDSQIFEVMPRVTVRKEAVEPNAEKMCSKDTKDKAQGRVPLAEPEDLSDEEIIKPVKCWKATMVILILFSFLSVIGSVLVFEAETHSTAMNELRSSSYMERLYSNLYRPLRQRILG